jgi:hypothetical protein
MPTVALWANDLREAFGHAEMQEAMRSQGYMASEGGRTIDTRKPLPGTWVTPVLPAPVVVMGAKRGR